jgi:hypothetical protein
MGDPVYTMHRLWVYAVKVCSMDASSVNGFMHHAYASFIMRHASFIISLRKLRAS